MPTCRSGLPGAPPAAYTEPTGGIWVSRGTRPANWPIWECPKIWVCPKLTPPTGRLRGCPTQSHQLANWVSPEMSPPTEHLRARPRLWVCPNPPRQLVNLGVQNHASQGQSAGPNSTHPRRILRTGERPPEPTAAAPATAQVPRADWRVPRTARRGPRGACPSTAPLQAPGAAGALDGEVLTNKSSQGRADAQRLVATRLLDRVHDPLGHFSRLQRIYPRAR